MARKLDKRTIDIPKEILKQLYVEDRMTIKEISEKLGYSVVPVWKSLKRHGIKLKSANRHSLACEKAGITEKILKRLYLKRQLPIHRIAIMLNVNRHTITGALKYFDIPIRSQEEVNKLSAQKRVWGKDGHGHNWQGGRSLNGYPMVWNPEHPRSHQGYVYEHILIWEQTYGKRVPKDWHVHHLNGMKTDNRPENLHALPNGEHIGLARPYKTRIKQLETELKELRQLKLARG